MQDHELDQLIAQSLKAFDPPEPPETVSHHFSPGFEQRMRRVLKGDSLAAPRRFRIRRIWYVLIAALLAMLAMTVTGAVASKTNRVHTFADGIGYLPLGDDAKLEKPELSYDLTPLTEHFTEGVEIHCGEQLTRFYRDAESGEFVEFSSYPKIAFRYHISLPDIQPEQITLNERTALYFGDQGGVGYLLWDTPSAVIVLRSDLPQGELCEIAQEIKVFENGENADQ